MLDAGALLAAWEPLSAALRDRSLEEQRAIIEEGARIRSTADLFCALSWRLLQAPPESVGSGLAVFVRRLRRCASRPRIPLLAPLAFRWAELADAAAWLAEGDHEAMLAMVRQAELSWRRARRVVLASRSEPHRLRVIPETA